MPELLQWKSSYLIALIEYCDPHICRRVIPLIPPSYLIALIEYCDFDIHPRNLFLVYASYLIALIEYCDLLSHTIHTCFLELLI